MSEIEELRAEVERLTRWKSEATEVILGLQDLGRALELPLGERITGEAAAEAARTLKAEVERLRAAVTRVGEADQQTIHMYSDAMVKWNARAESAESALTSEREAHAGLRARLEALHFAYTLYEPCPDDVTGCSAEVCTENPHDGGWFHSDQPVGKACGECNDEDGEPAEWPCGETLRAILAEPAEATASRPPETCGAGSIAPVAAEEGGEQEAGEGKRRSTFAEVSCAMNRIADVWERDGSDPCRVRITREYANAYRLYAEGLGEPTGSKRQEPTHD